jgi:hypothetical protein
MKELTSVIVNESIATTGHNFSGESLVVERGLREALVELYFIGEQPWSSQE